MESRIYLNKTTANTLRLLYPRLSLREAVELMIQNQAVKAGLTEPVGIEITEKEQLFAMLLQSWKSPVAPSLEEIAEEMKVSISGAHYLIKRMISYEALTPLRGGRAKFINREKVEEIVGWPTRPGFIMGVTNRKTKNAEAGGSVESLEESSVES